MRSPPVCGYEFRDQSVGFFDLGGVAAGDDRRFFVRRVVGVSVRVDANAHPLPSDLGVELGSVDILAPPHHLYATVFTCGKDRSIAGHVADGFGMARVPVKDLRHVGGQRVVCRFGREGHPRGLKILAVPLDKVAAQSFHDRLQTEADS